MLRRTAIPTCKKPTPGRSKCMLRPTPGGSSSGGRPGRTSLDIRLHQADSDPIPFRTLGSPGPWSWRRSDQDPRTDHPRREPIVGLRSVRPCRASRGDFRRLVDENAGPEFERSQDPHAVVGELQVRLVRAQDFIERAWIEPLALTEGTACDAFAKVTLAAPPKKTARETETHTGSPKQRDAS